MARKKETCTRYQEEWISGGGKGFYRHIELSIMIEFELIDNFLWQVIGSSYLARDKQKKPDVFFHMLVWSTEEYFCHMLVWIFLALCMLLSKWNNYDMIV